MRRVLQGVNRLISCIVFTMAIVKGLVTRRCTGWILIGVFALLVPLSAAHSIWHNRYWWIEHEFRQVVPGQVYAGAYQHPIPLRRILRNYRIKTVLSLLTEDSPGDAAERQVAAESGVAFRRVSIPSNKSQAGVVESVEEFLTARLPLIEEAVDILADPQNQPVFVHCEAGRHRTGAVVAVFRVRHCGWSEWAARKELKRWNGLDRHAWWPSLALHDYYAKHASSTVFPSEARKN